MKILSRSFSAEILVLQGFPVRLRDSCFFRDNADKEILGIQHRAACAHGLDKAPHIVAQRTGQTQQHQRRRAHDAGFVAVPAKVLAGAGDDVLKHCNDRGEAGEGHEQKEQCTPQAAACHVRKDVGQGNKNQARACVG